MPLDACHDAGVCDPSTGMCSNPAKPDNSPCDDGDLCTQGACVGTPIADCGTLPPGSGPGDSDPPTSNPPEGDDNQQPPDNPAEPDPGDGEAPHPNPDPADDDPGVPSPPPCPPGEPCGGVSGEAADADEDGVPDQQDQCQGTVSGIEVDEAGCPLEDPQVGRGTWTLENPRRCGACGSLGAIGVVAMICVPATVLITGRPRGRENHCR